MGSSTAENYCLHWNDFASNVSGSFRELRTQSDFFDVTLACDEGDGEGRGSALRAHKVVLSASSPRFNQMLRNMAKFGGNQLIYLSGVRMVDLEYLLDFMYRGEVNLAPDDLDSFLAVAERLEIKGLSHEQRGHKEPNSAKRQEVKDEPMGSDDTSDNSRLPSETATEGFDDGYEYEVDGDAEGSPSRIETPYFVAITAPSSSNPLAITKSSRTRKPLTLANKLKIIKRVEAGEKGAQVARSLNLSGSTVYSICKEAERVKASVKHSPNLFAKNVTRTRNSTMEKMEKMLSLWVEDLARKQQPISKALISQKAVSLVEQLKAEEEEGSATLKFVASNGWYENFKKRAKFHNIGQQNKSAEGGESDVILPEDVSSAGDEIQN